MQPPITRRFLRVLFVIPAFVLVPAARADLTTSVTSSAQALSGGIYQYTYTVQNLASSTLPVVAFDLNVAPTADLSAIQPATGFSATYQAGDSAINFNVTGAISDPPGSTILPPGGSGTFSFQSTASPTSQSYVVIGFDGSNFDTNFQSTTPGSSTTPEPGSALLLGIGAATALLAAKRVPFLVV